MNKINEIGNPGVIWKIMKSLLIP